MWKNMVLLATVTLGCPLLQTSTAAVSQDIFMFQGSRWDSPPQADKTEKSNYCGSCLGVGRKAEQQTCCLRNSQYWQNKSHLPAKQASGKRALLFLKVLSSHLVILHATHPFSVLPQLVAAMDGKC